MKKLVSLAVVSIALAFTACSDDPVKEKKEFQDWCEEEKVSVLFKQPVAEIANTESSSSEDDTPTSSNDTSSADGTSSTEEVSSEGNINPGESSSSEDFDRDDCEKEMTLDEFNEELNDEEDETTAKCNFCND